MENLTSLLLAASVSMNGRRLAQAARGQLTLGHLAGRAYSMDLRLRRISAARSLTSGSDVKIMRLCFVFTEKGGTSMLSRVLSGLPSYTMIIYRYLSIPAIRGVLRQLIT